MTVTDEKGKTVVSDTFIDDYYVFDGDNTADFRIGSDTLESGKTYTLKAVAQSAYQKKSDALKIEFTAQ